MAWNGSSSAGASVPAPKKPAKKSPGLAHGLIAGAAIVLIGVISLYFVTSESDEQPVDKKGPAKIAEVEADIAASKTNKVDEVKVKPIDPNARPTKVGEIVNGYIKLPSGRLHRIKGEYTNTVATSAAPLPYAIFEHECDNEIACYLTLEPGRTLVGTPRYNGRFKKQFLESLETPLIPPKDAGEADRELYKAVREAKIELKAAYDRGEDIEKIMLDTRKELQDMASYRLALEQELRGLIREQASNTDDIDDFIGAANKMLESKGIAPMNFGPIAKKRFEILVQETQKGLE